MIQPADYVEKILQMTDVAHVYAYNAMVRKDQCYLSVIWSVTEYFNNSHLLHTQCLCFYTIFQCVNFALYSRKSQIHLLFVGKEVGTFTLLI